MIGRLQKSCLKPSFEQLFAKKIVAKSHNLPLSNQVFLRIVIIGLDKSDNVRIHFPIDQVDNEYMHEHAPP